jgi:murein L,D-transpeptidase YafK
MSKGHYCIIIFLVLTGAWFTLRVISKSSNPKGLKISNSSNPKGLKISNSSNPKGLKISNSSNPQGLKISDDDYAEGSKRFLAVSQKVTPALKASFKEKKLDWRAAIFVRVFKEEKELEIWVKNGRKFSLFQTYDIARASGKPGPKEREGDRQVPEGFYFVKPDQMNPQSDFHLSFNIGYPNRFDTSHNRTGSFIMIHGSDISSGCLAMTDSRIEEIYTLADAAFKGGQKLFHVHIFPFRMTDNKMEANTGHKWHSFWRNLRKGFQWFEEKEVPPNVTVKDSIYQFE